MQRMTNPYRRDSAWRVTAVDGGLDELRDRLIDTKSRVGLSRRRAPRLLMPGIYGHFAHWLWGYGRLPLTLDVGAVLGPDGVTEAVVYAVRGPRDDLAGEHRLRVELPARGRAVVEVVDVASGAVVLRHVWPDEAYEK
jgi:hypothetical protein